MCNILAIISQIGDLQIEKIILDFFLGSAASLPVYLPIIGLQVEHDN